ncbi:MoaD/ThiS family protein [Flavobacteriaceae bacterium]|nr:MoaD/ThiS family protein [Flavobacteriaceae bacterium]
MLITIKYFGMLVEDTKTTEEILNFDTKSITIKELKKFICKRYRGLESKTYNIAINQKIAGYNDLITDGNELALLPPFAGG